MCAHHHTLLLAVACAIAGPVKAQTATSIANGLFYMPTTWSCFCIPTAAMDLTVAHTVTLNNDVLLGPGSITISAGAALVQDGTPRQLLMTGGAFTNQGNFVIDRMAVQGGTFTNTGAATIRAQSNYAMYTNSGTVGGMDTLFTEGSLTNSGQFTVGTVYTGGTFVTSGPVLGVDSLYNAGYLEVTATGVLDSDSLYNAVELINSGTVQTVAFTNAGTWQNLGAAYADDLLNEGTFENHGTVQATGSMTNRLSFINHNTGAVDLGESFLNANEALEPNAGEAVFTNNGQVDIGDSWYNFDQIGGSSNGDWTVQDSTVNLGTMTGPFHFCDLTPPPAWPFVDYNLGTVGNDVVFCQGMGLMGRSSSPELLLRAHPVPATNDAQLWISLARGSTVRITLLDALGAEVQLVHQGALPAGEHRCTLSLHDLPPGGYTVRLIADDEQAAVRVAVVR